MNHRRVTRDRAWDTQVAREVMHQEVIEATFDRAEAYARLGDFKRAVEWLDRAATVGGELPATIAEARTLGSGPGRPGLRRPAGRDRSSS